MSSPSPEFVLQLLVTLATGAGVYAGQKADIAALSERVTAVREVVTQQGAQIDKLRDREGVTWPTNPKR